MKNNTKRQIKIIVVVNLAHASWRDFLSGFLEATGKLPFWNVRIVDPRELTATRIDEFELEGVDGIVIGDISREASNRLISSHLPLVVIGSQSTSLASRLHNIVNVHNDDEDIGKSGADTLATLGNFATYGFIPVGADVYWSKLREKGFKTAAARHGHRAKIYKTPFVPGSHEDILRLSKWLSAMEKPAALMAAYDGRALNVLEACKAEGIPVPEQVCLLGVDNDRLLCETVKPTLSSIAPDHVGEGKTAAEALSVLLRHASHRPKQVLCSAKTTVQRESTSPVSPVRSLIDRALSFIDAHASENIRTADVVAYLGVSRSLADLRFRQYHGTPIASVIRERRLEEVKKRLRRTKTAILNISRECGFENVNHLKNIFKRRFGISMSAYRDSLSSSREAEPPAIHS